MMVKIQLEPIGPDQICHGPLGLGLSHLAWPVFYFNFLMTI